jgi:ketosteroid isomerase-like protein
MSDQANVALVLRVYDEFSRGDIAAVLTHLDPQADLNFEGPSTIPWAGNWHGREGWAKFFQAVGENLDDLTLTMEPFAVQGDNVVAAGRYQARVKLTGKRIDSPLVHLWTIRNGMVVRCQELTNTAAEAAACTAGAVAR